MITLASNSFLTHFFFLKRLKWRHASLAGLRWVIQIIVRPTSFYTSPFSFLSELCAAESLLTIELWHLFMQTPFFAHFHFQLYISIFRKIFYISSHFQISGGNHWVSCFVAWASTSRVSQHIGYQRWSNRKPLEGSVASRCITSVPSSHTALFWLVCGNSQVAECILYTHKHVYAHIHTRSVLRFGLLLVPLCRWLTGS